MASSKDLTPKFATLKTVNQATYIPPSTSDLAQNIGGLSIFSNSFKRGQGNKVFGTDESGLWLGAADFKDAPFTVDYDGQQTTKATDGSGNTSFFNAQVLGFSVGTLWSIVIGDPTQLPVL